MSSATVRWTALSSDGGSPITDYELLHRAAASAAAAPGDEKKTERKVAAAGDDNKGWTRSFSGRLSLLVLNAFIPLVCVDLFSLPFVLSLTLAAAGPGLEAKLESLTAGSRYEVRVLARNAIGASPPSAIASFITVAGKGQFFASAPCCFFPLQSDVPLYDLECFVYS